MLYGRHRCDTNRACRALRGDAKVPLAQGTREASFPLTKQFVSQEFIDDAGIHPLNDELQDGPQRLRTFWNFDRIFGLINYIVNSATILAPLNRLLRKDAKWS